MKASALAVLVVVTAAPALAENPDLARALKLYNDLDYMQALDALQAADARPESTLGERVEIQIYTGMISMALGDETKARAAFARAIALDRQAQAPEGASPKVATILDQLRTEAPDFPTAPPPQASPYAYGAPYYAPPQSQPAPPPQAEPYAATSPQGNVAATSSGSGSSNSWSAITGFSAMAVGVAGVAVGVYFQLAANSDVATGNAETTGAAALNDQSNANQAWTYSEVGYVVGGVLLVGGLALVIVHYASPSHPAAPHAGELSVTPNGVAIAF
jgi:hypothetical protein